MTLSHREGQRGEDPMKEARIFIKSYLRDQLPLDYSVTRTHEF